MRNRRFIRELNPNLRTSPIPDPVMKKRLKKPARKPVPEVTARPHEVEPEQSQEPEAVVGADDQPLTALPSSSPMRGLEGGAAGLSPASSPVSSQGGPGVRVSQYEIPDDDPVDAAQEQAPPVQVEKKAENPEPEVGSTRPRRTVKPNPKYSSDVYDLSYVGHKSRHRSRRSIRRAGT